MLEHLPHRWVAAAFAASIVIGCYSERLPPPNYRYTCDKKSDCDGDESCISGLCQLGCTQFTDEICTDAGFAACVNGVCGNTCTVGDNNCATGQDCLEFQVDLGDIGGIFGNQIPDNLGVCGSECDDDCPSGELCFEGFCVGTCQTTDDCPARLVCTSSLCLPEVGGSTSAGDESGGGSSSTMTATGGTTE